MGSGARKVKGPWYEYGTGPQSEYSYPVLSEWSEYRYHTLAKYSYSYCIVWNIPCTSYRQQFS
eukprot:scaffold354126_cov14-Prasinocladus_malaysianus.AAC.1